MNVKWARDDRKFHSNLKHIKNSFTFTFSDYVWAAERDEQFEIHMNQHFDVKSTLKAWQESNRQLSSSFDQKDVANILCGLDSTFYSSLMLDAADAGCMICRFDNLNVSSNVKKSYICI